MGGVANQRRGLLDVGVAVQRGAWPAFGGVAKRGSHGLCLFLTGSGGHVGGVACQGVSNQRRGLFSGGMAYTWGRGQAWQLWAVLFPYGHWGPCWGRALPGRGQLEAWPPPDPAPAPPQLAEQSLMKSAIKTSEESWIEQQMLEDKKRATDWEATNEAIEEQVARESYLQWLRDQEKQARQVGTPGTPHTPPRDIWGPRVALCGVLSL